MEMPPFLVWAVAGKANEAIKAAARMIVLFVLIVLIIDFSAKIIKILETAKVSGGKTRDMPMIPSLFPAVRKVEVGSVNDHRQMDRTHLLHDKRCRYTKCAMSESLSPGSRSITGISTMV